MSDSLSDSHVIGRKEHRCYLCELPIAKGERHRVHVGIFDGEFHRSRYHAQCDRVPDIDHWDCSDWEEDQCGQLFRERLEELRADGKLEVAK